MSAQHVDTSLLFLFRGWTIMCISKQLTAPMTQPSEASCDEVRFGNCCMLVEMSLQIIDTFVTVMSIHFLCTQAL